jgi:hypothetical protein
MSSRSSCERMPVSVVNAYSLSDLVCHERALLVAQTTHINLEMKPAVRGKFGANTPRNDIEVPEALDDSWGHMVRTPHCIYLYRQRNKTPASSESRLLMAMQRVRETTAGGMPQAECAVPGRADNQYAH